MVIRGHNSNGFSLVEILVGLVILGVLLTAIYSLFMSANKSRISQDLEVEMQQNARSAAEFVARELRNIGPSPDCIGVPPACPPITQAISCMYNTNFPCGTSGDKIIFFSMTDCKTAGHCNDTRIFSWSLADKMLRFRFSKNPSGSEDRLADHITAFTLTPRDDKNNITNILDNVRRIDITITAQTSRKDPNTKDFRTYSTTTSVTMRN